MTFIELAEKVLSEEKKALILSLRIMKRTTEANNSIPL